MTDLKLKPCPAPGCKRARRVEHVNVWDSGVASVQYKGSCECGASGPWRDTPEDAAVAWFILSSAADLAAHEQMEADCRAVCEYCAAAIEFHNMVTFAHKIGDYDGEICKASEIREAFRAANEEGEEVGGG